MSGRGRPRTPDILTPREWEVMELVRRGYSNREIAEELGISLGGAKYHVSEIISKLGVSSREEAAAWRPQRRPALVPFAALLIGRNTTGGIALKVVVVAAIVVVAVSILVAAVGTRSDRPDVLGGAAEQPLATEVPESRAQLAHIGPHTVGYIRGGGFVVGMQGNILRLEKQVGLGEVTFAIDERTRFLWATGDRILFDSRTDGIREGAFAAVAFESPIDGDLASESGTAVDTVVVGYFKYLRGEVLDFGENWIDFEIDPELEDTIGTQLRNADGLYRVWIDPNAVITDMAGAVTSGSSLGRSPARRDQAEGLRAGVTVTFSGLINTEGDPVAFSVNIY